MDGRLSGTLILSRDMVPQGVVLRSLVCEESSDGNKKHEPQESLDFVAH